MGNIASHPDIMQYESKIWACADTLIACSIKQSDFQAYMMHFFALVMLEGRMLNKIAQIEVNEGITYAEDPEAFIVAYLDEKCGKIDAIIEKITTKIERLKEHKRSLINEVVTGKRAIINNSSYVNI